MQHFILFNDSLYTMILLLQHVASTQERGKQAGERREASKQERGERQASRKEERGYCTGVGVLAASRA